VPECIDDELGVERLEATMPITTPETSKTATTTSAIVRLEVDVVVVAPGVAAVESSATGFPSRRQARRSVSAVSIRHAFTVEFGSI